MRSMFKHLYCHTLYVCQNWGEIHIDYSQALVTSNGSRKKGCDRELAPLSDLSIGEVANTYYGETMDDYERRLGVVVLVILALYWVSISLDTLGDDVPMRLLLLCMFIRLYSLQAGSFEAIDTSYIPT